MFEQPKQEKPETDPEIVDKIREQFADEWEELVTGPERVNEQDFEYVEKIRAGEKVPKRNKWLHDKLVRIGQDFRLGHEQIARLKEIFLE